MRAYFISGLGADSSVFSQLNLYPEIEVIHLQWFVPEPMENISHYARRMAENISSPEDAVLLGLSFGGLIAIEISKLLGLRNTIVINTAKRRGEIPFHLRAIGTLNIHKLFAFAPSFFLQNHALAHRFFGTKSQSQKEHLSRILTASDPHIVEWSIDQLLRWKNDELIPGIIHVHGSNDVVFPIRNVKADHVIKGGPHFMVSTHAREVSELLNRLLLGPDYADTSEK